MKLSQIEKHVETLIEQIKDFDYATAEKNSTPFLVCLKCGNFVWIEYAKEVELLERHTSLFTCEICNGNSFTWLANRHKWKEVKA